jgi:hypothetical protein
VLWEFEARENRLPNAQDVDALMALREPFCKKIGADPTVIIKHCLTDTMIK